MKPEKNLHKVRLRQAPGLAPAGAAPVVDPAALPQPDPANPAVPVNQDVPPANPAVPVPAAPQNPAVPVNNPTTVAAVPVMPGAVTPINQALPAAPTTNAQFVSVQWVETWVGGTSQTWVPVTVSFRFTVEATAAGPGKGQIGMGTLTGDTGKTKTFVLGAAPTQTAAWARGVVAAVGVGLAGLVV